MQIIFTSSQSDFLSGDSCITQLLSIKHEIQAAFDNNPTVDVRGDKAFDKVWHSGLSVKFQVAVVLYGQRSHWRKVNSGVLHDQC